MLRSLAGSRCFGRPGVVALRGRSLLRLPLIESCPRSNCTLACSSTRIYPQHNALQAQADFSAATIQGASRTRIMVVRTFADGASGGDKGGSKAQASGASTDNNDDMTKEIVLTPGEKVVAATRLTMWAGIAALAGVCAYYIGKELLPTKMSPNRVFDRSLEVVRSNEEVKHRFGEPLKGYGRDHGGHREGRRNFIEHTEYKSDEDGSKRTRVRYNLEGRHGKAFVFAEVSSDMPAGEFVYVLVQDKASGRVITVVDNRAALTAARLAAGSKEAQSAMAQLLSGGGSERK